MKRDGRLDGAIAALLGFLAFLLYLRTVAPTVLFADAGEFQFVPYVLGIAHPTGYPLYLLLGWLWSHLTTLGDVAYRMNLFSALWGGLTIGLLYLAGTKALGRAGVEPVSLRRGLVSIGALTLATSGTLWSKAVEAEVYTLNAAFVALTLLLLLTWAEAKRREHLYFFALVYGLSLTHHSTMILLAPAYLAFIWLTNPRPLKESRSLVVLLLLTLLPLLLYLYIPWRAPRTSYLHIPLGPDRELVLYDNSLRGFLRLVLSQTLGSQKPAPSGSISEHLSSVARLLGGEFTVLGFILGLLGWLRSIHSRSLLVLTSTSWLAFLLLGLLGSFLAYLFRFTGDIQAFLLPAHIIFALWIALGGATLAEALGRISKQATMRFALPLVLAILPLSLLVNNFSSMDRSQDHRAQESWMAILAQPIPQGAILVSNDRNEMMPLWYLQQVEGIRPDLLGLFPLITPEYDNIGRLLDALMGLPRPIYLIKDMPGLETKYDLRKKNSLVEVTGPVPLEEPRYTRQLNYGPLELVGYDQEPKSLRPGEELKVVLYWRVSEEMNQVYSSYVHLVDETGHVLVQSDHQPGGVYYPTNLWAPGETLRDEHHLIVPPSASKGAYDILTGLYQSNSLEPLGKGSVLGRVGVKTDVITSPPEIQHMTGIDFGDEIALLGYNLQRQGETLGITFYWQAKKEGSKDYTVFLHLIDGKDEIAAQEDSEPQGGRYPTSVWDKGEVVIDPHSLSLEGLPAGEYRVRIGLYLYETMKRLTAYDKAGQILGDSVELEEIEIEP